MARFFCPSHWREGKAKYNVGQKESRSERGKVSDQRDSGPWVRTIETLRDEAEAKALAEAMASEQYPVDWAFTEKHKPAICLKFSHVASKEWQAEMGVFAKKWLDAYRKVTERP